MLGLLIFSIIIGGIVSAVTGISFLFWVVAIALFICGLPFALINGFINDKIDRAQDRADYREYMRQAREDERELMRQIHDDLKNDELSDKNIDFYIDNRKYYDNRKVNINNKKKKNNDDDFRFKVIEDD